MLDWQLQLFPSVLLLSAEPEISPTEIFGRLSLKSCSVLSSGVLQRCPPSLLHCKVPAAANENNKQPIASITAHLAKAQLRLLAVIVVVAAAATSSSSSAAEDEAPPSASRRGAPSEDKSASPHARFGFIDVVGGNLRVMAQHLALNNPVHWPWVSSWPKISVKPAAGLVQSATMHYGAEDHRIIERMQACRPATTELIS